MRVPLPSGKVIHTEHVIVELEQPARARGEEPGLVLVFAVPFFQPAMIQAGAGGTLSFNSGPWQLGLEAEDAAAYRKAMQSRGGTVGSVLTT